MRTVFVLIAYLAFINLAGFLLMGADKRRARRSAYRIPEATFFLLALIGACIGIFLGIFVFRHKTKHPAFFVGMPLIFVMQLVLLFILHRAGFVFIFL